MVDQLTKLDEKVAKFKLVFLGDICVGKTSIINWYMYGSIITNYKATAGIDFLSKTIYLDNRTVRLQLWDTAGLERFRTLIPNYIRNSSVATIVFDITNRQTFENCDKWAEEVKKERGNNAIIVFVGNKSDQGEERAVTVDEAQAKSGLYGAVYFETSAKTGDNVQLLFNLILNIIT